MMPINENRIPKYTCFEVRSCKNILVNRGIKIGVVLNKTENVMGMVKKIKDYITYGEIDEATFKLLVEKRGKVLKDEKEKSIEFNGKKYRPFFALSPPLKPSCPDSNSRCITFSWRSFS